MKKSKHDQIAENLAKKEKANYNKGKGPDIKGKERIIEVATHQSDLYSSIDQVKNYKKPKYLATSTELIDKAKNITKGTGIGVMGPTGVIKKKARS
jgi:hypothetical protein